MSAKRALSRAPRTDATTRIETVLHGIVRRSPSINSNTLRVRLSDLDQWVRYAGPDPANWSRKTAQDFYLHLLERMTPQNANRIMRTLRSASHWWAVQEQDDRLRFAVVQQRKGETPDGGSALEEPEAQRLIAASAESAQGVRQQPRRLRDLAMAVMFLETGMRPVSLISMQIEWTGPVVAGLLLERGTWSPVDYPSTAVLMKGKGNERFLVPLTRTAIAALAPWLAYLRQHDITKGAVFRSLHSRTLAIGSGLTTMAIYDIVCGWAERARLKEVTPRTFRKTFVTWRLNAGWTPQQVASVTFHVVPGAVPHARIGAMRFYYDPKSWGPHVDTGTPSWLRQAVAARSGAT